MGSSPEEIAAETGWSLDRVQRYADQILIERGYVADRAQQVELRTTDGPMTLGEAALGTVLAEGLDDRDLLWDSWRRPDGRWVVVASVLTDEGEIRASWFYDTTGRTVQPQDEAARWLMGASEDDLDHVMAQQTVIIPTEPRDRPRLIAVSEPPATSPSHHSEAHDVEAHQPSPLTRVTSSRPSGPARQVSGPRQQRSMDEVQAGEFADDYADDGFESAEEFVDDIGYPIDEAPIGGRGAAEDDVPESPVRSWSDSTTGRRPSTAPGRTTPRPPAPPPVSPTRSSKGRGKRRASVPTWDEILFGATRNDDA